MICETSSGEQTQRSKRRSNAPCSPTSSSKATSARCWPPRITSISSSTARQFRTPTASSTTDTGTPPHVPIPIYCGDSLNDSSLIQLLRAIVANNRAGGWRQLAKTRR